MTAATIEIRESPVALSSRCTYPGCEATAGMMVTASGTVVKASTFTCHAHILDGHVKALRMYAGALEDNLAEMRGEFEPIVV